MKKKSAAFSLVEVLVALGLMSLISLGMMSFFQSQITELKAMSQKIALNDISNQLQNSFKNKNFCSCILRSSTFDTATKTWSAPISSIPAGFSAAPAVPAACTAVANTLVPAAGNSFPGETIKTSGITWKDISPIAGNVYKGKINVGLDRSSLVRSVHDLEVSVVFKVDPVVPSAATLVSCDSQDIGTLKVVGASDPGIQPGGLDTPGKTGMQACADIGKTCVSVSSLNTIIHDAGCPGATHCMHVCMTWYSQPLPGVALGTDLDNVHDCSAQLGFFTTYLHVGVVRCGGWFSALCE